MIEYRTLNVRVEHLREHTYEAIVHGPGGDGRVQFEIPADMPGLDAVAMAVSRPRSARRRIENDETALAREFGARLFDLVFQGTARDVMRMSLAEARNDELGLRLMLELEGAPKLRDVPWELLWDRPKFVSTSVYTPIVRYVDLPVRPRPLEVKPPLRVLGMVSSPGDVRALDTASERALLDDACGALDEQNLLAIDWVEQATLRGLLERLDSGNYHVFHFIGHGDFDEAAADGVLLFEGPAGRSHRVTGTELGTILSDHHSLRLAVINACEGARIADDWGGIAGSLMQYGLPAVIAMQYEISDEAALSFARGFYGSVARNHPVDEALGDARRGMFADGYGLEWATPAMFTSVTDCRLFDVRWEQASDERDAPLSKLSLSLDSEPRGADGVTWRAEFVNEGALELSELQPLAGDGRPLEQPFSLAGGERRTITWDGEPGEASVSVAGTDTYGRIVSERASAVADAPAAAEPAEPAPTRAPEPPPPEPAPIVTARARRRRGPLIAAAIVGVAVVAILVAVLAGGGESAGTIAERIGMHSDAKVLSATKPTAFVGGDGAVLTEVGLDDRKKDVPLTGLGTVDAPSGRSMVATDPAIYLDRDADSILELLRNGTRGTQGIGMPHSAAHLLAVSGDTIWIVSPDSSKVSTFPLLGERREDADLNIPPGSATQIAVTEQNGYVLFDKGDPARQGIVTIDPSGRPAPPPMPGLAGSAIRTGDGFLMVLHGDALDLVTLPRGPKRSNDVGAGVRGFDFNAGRLWVTYEDGILRRFDSGGSSAGDALKLGGKPLAIDARDDRAWVLVETDQGGKELLDVRP